MRTGNSAKIYDWASEESAAENIIYLSDHRERRSKRPAGRGDVLWNILYIAACLAVPLVLFLH